MDNRIEMAESLYKNQKYSESFKICMDLMKEGKYKKEVYQLAAKNYLFSLDDPLNDKSNQTFLKSYMNACSEATTIEDLLELKRDMVDAFNEWKAKTINVQLAMIEKNPTFEQWRKYICIPAKYIELEYDIKFSVTNDQIVQAYCDKKEIKNNKFNSEIRKEFGDRFKATKGITQKEIHTLEYETAQRIFSNAQEKHVHAINQRSDAESLKKVVKEVFDEFYLADLIVKCALPSKEDDSTVRCERLKLSADIYNYLLSAMLYPNGIPMYMLSGNLRIEDIEKLKNIYDEIRELDPSFVAPELPSADTTISATQSGGGCYVATAIYGSYDCPEVWTLRRFRDNTLAETWHGRIFIHTYYAISPTLVKYFGHTKLFKNFWKPMLDRMVCKLNNDGIENTPYNDRTW